MNIWMVTNSYAPSADGVARSIVSFSAELRRLGHRVLVIAPYADDVPPGEIDVVRIPVLTTSPGSELTLTVPLPAEILERLDASPPDVVHSHHPFLLGATAVRLAARYRVPLVFSHHASYEFLTPSDSPALRHFVSALGIGYGNLADAVIAPSSSIAARLRSRGMETPVAIIPPGIDRARFRNADGAAGRRRAGISADAFVVGHVGRLVRERNITFLVRALTGLLQRSPHGHVLIVGDGPERNSLAAWFKKRGDVDRVHFTGPLEGEELADAYGAMNVFAYTARTGTRGIILAEALAAGVPVVAVDAPGVRELVKDGVNGRLLPLESRRGYVAALEQFANLTDEKRQQFRSAARASSEKYDMSECIDRTLALYRQVQHATPRSREAASSVWERASQQIDVELKLWSARGQAAGAAFTSRLYPSRYPVLRHVFAWWRRFRRWISRREWSVKLLNLPVSEGTTDEPGLVLLQIDGLSRDQLDRAIAQGRMPFLRRLLERESYRIETMYSGQPTTTPAVLGELFYGVEQAVPAFGFRDHRGGQIVEMFQPGIASQVQGELAQQGEGLFEGGSVYCDIYSGGAYDSSFCPATTGWRNLEDASTWRRVALYLMNVMSLLRIAGNLVVELVVAIRDFILGVSRGRDFWRELLYIPRRLIVNIILQETETIGAEVDVTRGVNALHANFLGYDENAHRRGPDARFAHYALHGIDRAIRRIWNAAHASHRRNYHVWIMADHGQEHVIPYSREFGRDLQKAVCALYRPAASESPACGEEKSGPQLQRSRWFRQENPWKEMIPFSGPRPVDDSLPITVGVGPLGYVYWPERLDAGQKDAVARRLVSEVRVPLVLAALDETVWAWTDKGRFRMPEEASQVLVPAHPHLSDVSRDLARLCFHADAGDFVISGWRNDRLPLSFVSENGAHGGPGPHETSGFVMLPPDAPFPDARAGTFRPGTLRRMAQSVLRRGPLGVPHRRERDGRAPLRIVTYNVHSCIGLDGRLSPARIARVLAAIGPDVIALQELDVLRNRTGLIDQADQIARALEMELHFHPSFEVEGRYGNAVLSRLPTKLIKAGPLSQGGRRGEPRGALWVEIDAGVPLQLITTHLGTSPAERDVQIEHLLGADWLAHPQCQGPLVFCGDLNALPGSSPHRRVCSRLHDAQLVLKQRRPRRTWFGPLPLLRIDHLFVNDLLEVRRVDVPRTHLSKIASDHLPLVVDLVIPAEHTDAQESTEQNAESRDRQPTTVGR